MPFGIKNDAAHIGVHAQYHRKSNQSKTSDAKNSNEPSVLDMIEISEKAKAAQKENLSVDDRDSEINKQVLSDSEAGDEASQKSEVKSAFVPPIHEPDENGKSSNLEDPTRRLTRMLVAARTINEVHSVLSEAFKKMGDIIQAAASGDEDARRILGRLNKLIRRATRKVSDLNKEDQTRIKEANARKKEIEQLARQLELELKQRIAERKRREKGYLRDKDSRGDDSQSGFGKPSKMPTDAQIKAMALQAAQAAVMAQSASSSPVGEGGADVSSEGGLSGAVASEGSEGSSEELS